MAHTTGSCQVSASFQLRGPLFNMQNSSASPLHGLSGLTGRKSQKKMQPLLVFLPHPVAQTATHTRQC